MERKRSDVWMHFDIKGDKAECRYCKAVLSTRGGGSGNLQRHLRKKHVTIEITPVTYSRLVTSRSRLPFVIENTATAPPQFVSPCLPTTSVPHQTPISKFIDVIKPISVMKTKNINDQLLKMIVKEYFPFSIVEDKEFKNFVRLLCPAYTLPSRKTLTNSTMPMKFKEVSDIVKIK